MAIDATFWVAVSFFIFVAVLVYFKIPQKVNETLNKLISDIKNEIDESEKLRKESKIMLDNAQAKLDSAKLEVKENNKIILETYLGTQDLVGSKINFKEHKIKIDSNYYFLGYQLGECLLFCVLSLLFLSHQNDVKKGTPIIMRRLCVRVRYYLWSTLIQ